MARPSKEEVIKKKNWIKKFLLNNKEMTNTEMLREMENQGIATTLDTISKYRREVEKEIKQGMKSTDIEDMAEYQSLMQTLEKMKKARDKTKKEWDAATTDSGKAQLGRLYKDHLREIANLKKEIMQIKIDTQEKVRPIYHIRIGDFKEAKEKKEL